MKRIALLSAVGAVLGAALVWAIWIGIGLPGKGLRQAQTSSVAVRAANPCNPDAVRAANPCNPDAVRAANPCNPDAARAANPCNPDAARAANPCNPDAVRAANPCNPDAARAANPCNPDAASAANPCNPCGGGGRDRSDRKELFLGWGINYRSFARSIGYVLSAAHGNRMVVTYVSPKSAAAVYQHNAQLVRQKRKEGFRSFPAGTVLVQESFDRAEAFARLANVNAGRSSRTSTAGDAAGNPCAVAGKVANPCNPDLNSAAKANPCNPRAARATGANPRDSRRSSAASDTRGSAGTPPGLLPGPVFFMKKEPAGYDATGGDWRYAATDSALRITIGEGNAGSVQFCKDCHTTVRNRGFVYAVDRP